MIDLDEEDRILWLRRNAPEELVDELLEEIERLRSALLDEHREKLDLQREVWRLKKDHRHAKTIHVINPISTRVSDWVGATSIPLPANPMIPPWEE